MDTQNQTLVQVDSASLPKPQLSKPTTTPSTLMDKEGFQQVHSRHKQIIEPFATATLSTSNGFEVLARTEATHEESLNFNETTLGAPSHPVSDE
ncbi:unnamed protein product [Amaranthus hypochondriacus]